jgi:sulfotransferase
VAQTPPQYHFISGLPRSGTTLLAALLRQNPRFHAGISSPVNAFFQGMLNTASVAGEFGSTVTPKQRRNVMRGLFHSYYQDVVDKPVIFDNNRGWSARMPALADVFPQAKVIACVRDVAWVMDSLERRYRADPFEHTRLYNDDIERNTVYSRVDTLGQRNRLVGYAWSALKEAFYGEQAGSLLIVDYDLLAQTPDKVLPLIYQFINEPYFVHDFTWLQFDTPEFDANLGLPGLHTVRERVSFEPRRTILPPDLFANYSKMNFWTDTANSRANVITIQNNS